MREIISERQAKICAKLDFCYNCGEPFTDTQPSTADHIPAKKIFRLQDRCWPLVLPAHNECNSKYSISDEQAKGLVTLLHPESTKKLPPRTKVVGIANRDGVRTAVMLQGLQLPTIISRIVRACHTALYGDFLPKKMLNKICLMSLPEFNPQTGNIAKNQFLPQHKILCKLIKDNRKIANVDRIHAYNGKFRFEVVWATSDDNRFNFAAFAIDLYSWHKLGNAVSGSQGCVGTYRINENAIPKEASIATKLELPYTYSEPLNPFEE